MTNASIQFAYPVESVSRKLTLRKNTASANGKVSTENGIVHFSKQASRFMGAGVKNNLRSLSGAEKKNYLFIRFNQRSTPVSADEIALRSAFTLSVKLAKKWAQDIVHITAIRRAWLSGETRKGVPAAGYTFRGWLTAVGYAVVADGGTIDSDFPNA